MAGRGDGAFMALSTCPVPRNPSRSLIRSTVSGADSYIIFVERDDARPSPFLFQTSVTTYQGHGAAHFALSGGWEYCMLRFMERQALDVTYCTNIDTHENPSLLLNHKAFLSVGHDEYWSWEMRMNITAARDRGVHLCVFSANTCYWQIRLESGIRGRPNRRIVAYKQRALLDDPYALDSDPDHDRLETTKWPRQPVKRLLGVMYVYDPVNGDVVIDAPDHWVFAGIGAIRGTRLPACSDTKSTPWVQIHRRTSSAWPIHLMSAPTARPTTRDHQR